MIPKPLISILTPLYNPGSYFAETVQSVLNQTYQNWEWVIIDDGSTDGTAEIINKLGDSRIHYTYQEHAGSENLAKTCNTALKLCNGNYIAILDHDDYWPDYKLKMQIKSFHAPDIVLSYGECSVVNHKGRQIAYYRPPSDRSIASNNPVGSYLANVLSLKPGYLPHVTIMMRKTSLTSIGGFVNVKYQGPDTGTKMRLSLEGRFAHLNCCLGYWRRHPSSLTVKADPVRKFKARIAFLSEFALQNEKRLAELGFVFNLDSIRKQWEEREKEYFHYLPYNRAMLSLDIDLFSDGRIQFKTFLKKEPSIKHRLMYLLFILSSLVRHDCVNTLVRARENLLNFIGSNRILL